MDSGKISCRRCVLKGFECTWHGGGANQCDQCSRHSKACDTSPESPTGEKQRHHESFTVHQDSDLARSTAPDPRQQRTAGSSYARGDSFQPTTNSGHSPPIRRRPRIPDPPWMTGSTYHRSEQHPPSNQSGPPPNEHPPPPAESQGQQQQASSSQHTQRWASGVGPDHFREEPVTQTRHRGGFGIWGNEFDRPLLPHEIDRSVREERQEREESASRRRNERRLYESQPFRSRPLATPILAPEELHLARMALDHSENPQPRQEGSSSNERWRADTPFLPPELRYPQPPQPHTYGPPRSPSPVSPEPPRIPFPNPLTFDTTPMGPTYLVTCSHCRRGGHGDCDWALGRGCSRCVSSMRTCILPPKSAR